MSSFCEQAITSDLKLEVQTVQRLCTIVDSPRSLAVSLLIEDGQWEQLLNLKINASLYQDPRTFAGDYLVSEVLSKSPNLPLGIDRQGRALDAFYDAELSCWFSNNRFFEDPHPEWTWRFKKHVSTILGPLGSKEVSSIASRSHFGPGASTGVRGVGSVASDKFDKPLHMTRSLYPFFRSILGERWWEHQSQTQVIVEGNKFTTVPKNAKTDRGICVEPTLNMYVQLGLGSFIRSRLARFGLNLNSQARNQELAGRAHISGLATIDLAQASDSVSWGLIFHFFPSLWQELLFLLRSEHTTLPDGEVMELGKLSSMGNGFTFELESLIFFSIVKTIVPKDQLDDCAVYGDDIIVPREYAEELIEALNFLGFRVNGQKSFLAGNFFESCGADFFLGHNVRPFYLRGRNGDIPYALQIANSLRSYAHRQGGEEFCDSQYQNLWKWLIRKVPSAWKRLRVPPTFGDCGVVSSYREKLPNGHPKGGIEGDLVRYRILKSKSITLRSSGVLLTSLARVSGLVRLSWEKIPGPPNPPRVAFSKGRQSVRGLFGRPVTKQAVVFDWPDGWDWA